MDDDRKSRLGATDAPCVLEVSPFRTGREVQLEKLDKIEAKAVTPAMSLGLALEPAILDIAEKELGSKLARQQVVWHPNDAFPFAATLDGRTEDQSRIVEVKTAGMFGPLRGNWGPPGTDEIPEHYLLQVHAQLACSGADVAYVYALLGGLGLMSYEVKADKELQERLHAKLAIWWARHVVEREPVPDSPKADLDFFKRIRRAPNSWAPMPEEADDEGLVFARNLP